MAVHPNVEVIHWRQESRLEDKRMLDRSGDFERYVLAHGSKVLADAIIKHGVVTWTTEEREYGSDVPAYLREGTARTLGAVGVVRERDEVARYAVQLFQMRERALGEAVKVLEGLLDGFTGRPDDDYMALRKAKRELEEARAAAVEPGMWRPMWTGCGLYGDRNEYLYADGEVRDWPSWKTTRVSHLEPAFEVDDHLQTSAIDEQHCVAWRPKENR